jgi:hypothetical protein
MEEEDTPCARRRIGVVAKQEFAARRDECESGLPFGSGLIGEAGRRSAGSLNRNHAAQRAADEERIVERPGGG